MRLVALLLLASAALAVDDDVRLAMMQMKSADGGVRYRGVAKVAAIGSRARAAAPLAVKLLRDPRWSVRDMAVKALVRIGKAGMPASLKALKSRDREVRLAVAHVWIKYSFDGRPHARKLVAHLKDPDEEVRLALARALATQGAETTPHLVQALGSRDDGQRDAAAWALAQDPGALRQLKAALDSKGTRRRTGAALALGRMGKKAATATGKLNELLTDKSVDLRAASAHAIGAIGSASEATVLALVRLLADSSAAVRDAAIGACARFESAAPALIATLATPTRAAAVKALVRMRDKATGPLQEALESSNAVVRAGAAEALGRLDILVRFDIRSLRNLLEDKATSVRLAAARAIARRGGFARLSSDPLVELLADADASVRVAAASALGEDEPEEEIVAALNKAASKDADPRVKLAATTALWRLGESPGLLALTRGMLGSDGDAPARAAAARSLGLMGHAAAPAIADLVAMLEDEQATLHGPAVEALGQIAAAHGSGVLDRAKRYKKATKPVRAAIESALRWLGSVQDTEKSEVNWKDGRWHSKRFVNHHQELRGEGGVLYSHGVTGLALSAYLSVGYTDRDKSPHAPHIREGLAFLLSIQDPDGCVPSKSSQHFMIAHSYASITLCEAWLVIGDPRYRRAARRALEFLCAARNPDSGWRYDPRDGENDTHATVAALTALAFGERGGLEIDPAVFVGGGKWIASMADPLGRIGYTTRGSWSARPEGLQEKFPPEETGAMTAAGLWGLALASRHGVRVPELKACYRTCLELLPIWGGGRTDLYYWYYGTLVFHRRQGKDNEAWRAKLESALLNSQRHDGPSAGSWDPAGPWGADGGRIYSTAINTLSLATPFRMTPDFAEAKPGGPFAIAARALRRCAKDKKKAAAVRARATHWLRRIG